MRDSGMTTLRHHAWSAPQSYFCALDASNLCPDWDSITVIVELRQIGLHLILHDVNNDRTCAQERDEHECIKISSIFWHSDTVGPTTGRCIPVRVFAVQHRDTHLLTIHAPPLAVVSPSASLRSNTVTRTF